MTVNDVSAMVEGKTITNGVAAAPPSLSF